MRHAAGHLHAVPSDHERIWLLAAGEEDRLIQQHRAGEGAREGAGEGVYCVGATIGRG